MSVHAGVDSPHRKWRRPTALGDAATPGPLDNADNPAATATPFAGPIRTVAIALAGFTVVACPGLEVTLGSDPDASPSSSGSSADAGELIRRKPFRSWATVRAHADAKSLSASGQFADVAREVCCRRRCAGWLPRRLRDGRDNAALAFRGIDVIAEGLLLGRISRCSPCP